MNNQQRAKLLQFLATTGRPALNAGKLYTEGGAQLGISDSGAVVSHTIGCGPYARYWGPADITPSHIDCADRELLSIMRDRLRNLAMAKLTNQLLEEHGLGDIK